MSHSAGDSGPMQAHLKLLATNLEGVATAATHVVINDGDWYDLRIWATGELPGDGALVHVPDHRAVCLSIEDISSGFVARVDGQLTISTPHSAEAQRFTRAFLSIGGRSEPDAAISGVADAKFEPLVESISFDDVFGGETALPPEPDLIVPELVMDFDEGVDAIEFMIEAFGFEDRHLLSTQFVSVDDPQPEIRLISLDGHNLAERSAKMPPEQ
ncbi:MAG: hypothetical protein AAGK00_08955 [Pseudomonadota bacterium]